MSRCLESYRDNLDLFYVKYMFLDETRRRISGYRIEHVVKDEGIVRRAVEIVRSLTSGKTIDVRTDGGLDEVLAHYLALMIVSQLPRRAWKRFADRESKIFSKNLRSEVSKYACTEYIASDLGIKISSVIDVLGGASILNGRDPRGLLAKLFHVAISVWDYIKYCPKNDPYWKLINRYVVNGYVLMRYDDLIRLIENAVEMRVLRQIESMSDDIIVKNVVENIRQRLSELDEVFRAAARLVRGSETNAHVVQNGRYPPCIEAIINEIRSGGNPSHMARFTVAAFLLRVGVDYEKRPVEEVVEDVVNLFRSVSDFDERITRYQVEHVAGLRGGRKFYMPPSCSDLISLGLCPVNGGCKVKNPLAYYVRSSRRREKSRLDARTTEGSDGASGDGAERKREDEDGGRPSGSPQVERA